MGLIKGVLKEELKNSLRLKKGYEKELKARPGGSIVVKNIRGNKYYYIAFRDGKKVRFVYKGKELSRQFLADLGKVKRLRGKYKSLLRQLNGRIKYLKKALRGKEDV